MLNTLLRFIILWGLLVNVVLAEDGYRLWLRYEPIADSKLLQEYKDSVKQIVLPRSFQGDDVIGQELQKGLSGLLEMKETTYAEEVLRDGVLVIGTPDTSEFIQETTGLSKLTVCGPEGYLIRSEKVNGYQATMIAANTRQGVLYGVFHCLRLMQTNQPIDSLDITERPALQLRLMNHWDNLNGSIERGYAGRSLWQWDELPETLSPHYADYARACASLGINGAVINNVNADPRILSPEYLRKVAALANVWRPYGVRIYLSVNFGSPMRLGELQTADPLDSNVIDWWKAKADEIYALIPDFGGFLVKANSEGQPGPKTYGRTHAEGANMLADALAPHQGNVMWRAFVYDVDVDPDRVKRAFIEFTRLDGQFRPNVAIQVKNGPLDFQPREPFHPLFGGMKETPVIAEIQPSQEYLGQAKHLVYHGTMWEEFLDSDTHAKGPGSTVGNVLAGKVHPYHITGMVAVTNPGLDTNWCGHHFSQSNWYAFGRLAWNPDLSAEQIADEWTRMTFTNEKKTVAVICDMMMGSHETFVNYTMPLGLHHLIGGDHYAPMPWNNQAPRADWTATYYHQASENGVGFDRTRRGSNAVEQYFPPVCDIFDDISKCPEKLLLWFHRCPWDYRMKSGKTLWDELCDKYRQGVEETVALQKTWQSLEGKIDSQRHQEIADRIAIQVGDAAKWRDQILDYFGQYADTPASLKEAYKDVFRMGTAVNRGIVSGRDNVSQQIVIDQFNTITSENEMKAESINPRPGVYNFGPADQIVEFAEEHNMFMVGHTLVWHNQTPQWFFQDADGNPHTREDLIERMRAHIQAVAGRYAGRIDAWDVVNEVIDNDGSYRPTVWVKGIGDGDELVKLAFKFAAESAPDAELYYNDFNAWRPAKRDGIVRMVKMLQAEEIRIDGIGIQGHWGLNYPKTEYIEAAINAYASLGVKVIITELDVDVLPLTKEGQIIGQVMSDPQFQLEEFKEFLDPYASGLPDTVHGQLADRYAELFEIFYRKRDKVDRVTLWGIHDGMSWKNGYPVPGRTNYPLLFNRDRQPKPAFNAVLNVPSQVK